MRPLKRIEYITQVTASSLEIPMAQILGGDRHNRYTDARAIITHISRTEGFTYEDIGIALGGRHHVAAMGSHRRAEKYLDVDVNFRKNMDTVKSFLGNSFQDYMKNDVHVKAVARMDLCIARVTSVLESLKMEMIELRSLKREFMKQRRRIKPGPEAPVINNNVG